MRQKILKSIKRRLGTEIAPQNPLKYLKDIDPDAYLNEVIAVLYLYTRPKKGKYTDIYMVEVISAIGHKMRNVTGGRRNSALAARTGAFILYTFQDLGILTVRLGQGKRGHAAYIVEVLEDDHLCTLWQELDTREIDKLPSLEPYAMWRTSRHATGIPMVKTGNKDVLGKINYGDHPILFDTLNKAQQVGWNINSDIFRIQRWALKFKTDAFADIWEQHNPEAKATKLREARAIDSIASRFLGETFYHLYYFDFRGRKYASSAYLHEQGSDVAKGLLLREDSKRIGKDGYFWLMVSIASNWGGESGREDNLKTDKIPLHDRYEWSINNIEILLSYAKSPKTHQGWMHADKPWQFLAACLELRECYKWANYDYKAKGTLEHVYEYSSSLECFIDGSNNGSQHLAALTRDEVTAPHVNLVPLSYPGDLYKYVGDHVWEVLAKKAAEMSIDEIQACEEFIDALIYYKRKYTEAPQGSDIRREWGEVLREFKMENKNIYVFAAPIYWLRITDAKEKRKIVKRNTMTLPYGGTPYGLGQQIIDDSKKHGIDLLLFLEQSWGAYLGREVFNDCKKSLKRPMKLLQIFEAAGKKAEDEGRFLEWTVPITNFPVVQNYTEGKVKKIWVQYGPPKGTRNRTGYYDNTMQLMVCFLEDSIPSKRKQSQGAAPNAIHSLDAGHLSMTVAYADFPVTTVHDSFGCLLADMPKLYKLIRETFVELHKTNPIYQLLKDIGGDIERVDFGKLDINLILESEYAFA